MNEFSVKKTVQALGYIQRRTNDRHYMKLLKILFFADRWLLRAAAMPMLNDTYYAMKYGPVCSCTDHIVRLDESYLAGLSEDDRSLVHDSIHALPRYEVEAADTGESSLSPLDRRAMDFAIEHFEEFDRFSLSDISHAYPEWKKFEGMITPQNRRFLMDYGDFFQNASADDPFIQKFLGGKDPFFIPQEKLDAVHAIYREYHGTAPRTA